MQRIEPRGGWVRSKIATFVLCSPTQSDHFKSLTLKIDLSHWLRGATGPHYLSEESIYWKPLRCPGLVHGKIFRELSKRASFFFSCRLRSSQPGRVFTVTPTVTPMDRRTSTSCSWRWPASRSSSSPSASPSSSSGGGKGCVTRVTQWLNVDPGKCSTRSYQETYIVNFRYGEF